MLYLLTTAFETFSQGKLDCTAYTFVVLKTCSSGIDLHCLSTAVNVLMCSRVVLKTCLCGIDSLCFLGRRQCADVGVGAVLGDLSLTQVGEAVFFLLKFSSFFCLFCLLSVCS